MHVRFSLIKLISIAIIVCAVIYFLSYTQYWPKSNQTQQRQISAHPVSFSPNSANDNKEVVSPDSSMKFSMSSFVKGQQKIYSFSLSDSQNNQKKIFTKIVSLTESMTIPDNSWSPSNNYVYIQDVEKGVKKTLVFKTNGETFKDSQYLDVYSIFTKNNIQFTYQEVTGWASPTLLILNTKEAHSYWFDVTSQQFIQLATHF